MTSEPVLRLWVGGLRTVSREGRLVREGMFRGVDVFFLDGFVFVLLCCGRKLMVIELYGFLC